jgi:uncharacterized membrane protein SpoIIM required for sporulation
VILDLKKFIDAEKPFWKELETLLGRLQSDMGKTLSLEEVQRLHYLYQRASAGLARVSTFSAEPQARRYLEGLVARAYAEAHESRRMGHRFRPFTWFFKEFPRALRRNSIPLLLSIALTGLGAVFGVAALAFDAEAKAVIMPFSHLAGAPSKRVQKEENATTDRLKGGKVSFSAGLMTHNIKVTLMVFAMGMTFGIGTLIMLFYNGAILGAVCFDYIADGQGLFLAGWLLPHGSVEIPAILLGGTAGLMLAHALVGWDKPLDLRGRMRALTEDLLHILGGAAVLLVWAGIIESFFSQYHEPYLPYWVKVSFGTVQLFGLAWLILFGGREKKEEAEA